MEEAKNQLPKIAIVVCAWPPQGGGMGNNSYYHAKHLSRLEYQVSVFTPLFPGTKKTKAEKFSLEYLPVAFPVGKAGFLFSLPAKLKDFDVIHFNYPFFGTDLLVWWFKIFNPKKKLFLDYKMDPIGQGAKKIFFWLYVKLFLGLLIRASERVGILSWDNAKNSYLKKYLKKYPEKFVELPNGVETDAFAPAAKYLALKDGLDIKSGEKVVVFVGGLGRLHFFKGVDILLAALKKLPDKKTKLLIIGDGDRRDYYERLAGELGLAGRVIFTGWVNNEELPSYYNLADILVLPSTARTECFGIVVAEAQACGVPAIVSNWPGVRSTIENGRTGLVVEPKNVDDLAEKISRLLADKELRREMSAAGRQRMVELYDWGKVIKKADKIYKELLN